MRWKWILGASAALILAVIVTVYIILSSYDFNKLKPAISGVVRDATGRELTLGGDIELDIGLFPRLVLENVKFENASWGSAPDLARIERLEVQVALLPLIGGNIRIRRLVAIGPHILIETNESGRSNLAFKPSRKNPETSGPEEKTPLPMVFFREICIEKGRLTYNDGPSGRSYEMELKNLTVKNDAEDDGLNLVMSGTYTGTPFEVEGTTGYLVAVADPQKVWPLKMSLKAGGVLIALEGTIRDIFDGKGLDLDFELQGKDLANLGRLTGTSLTVKGPFSISGRATDVGARKYKICGLKTSLGESLLEGSIAIDLDGKRPSIDADLYSQRLDVRPLLIEKNKTGGSSKKPAGEGPKRKKVFSNDLLPVRALNQVDGRVTVDVRELLFPGSAFEDVKLAVVLEKGNLAVSPFSARVGGGRLDGRFRLCTGKKIPTASLALNATKLDLERMMEALQYGEILEGKLDLEMDLKGRGRTPASLMAALKGKMALVAGKAKIANSYLQTFGADISSSISSLLKPSDDKTDYTQINCFVGFFDIEDGIAVTSALVMDTPFMVVGGNGEINLKTEEIDLSLDPSPKKGVAGLSMSLAELARPLKLGGTLASPSLGIDPARATLALGKAVGGVVLFGPAGFLLAFAGNSTDDENPCLAAIEAAEKKRRSHEEKRSKKKAGIVEKTMNRIGGTFKKLFANRTE